MKNCLVQYERASGQKVKFEKSSISFSANVLSDLRAIISDILAVPQETDAGKYLGVPSLIGQNKKATFTFIKEKISSRLQGWKNNFFFKSGQRDPLEKCRSSHSHIHNECLFAASYSM